MSSASVLPRQLTKSLYTLGEMCPKALWLSIHRPDAAAKPSAGAQARMAVGQEIGRLARRSYPSGELGTHIGDSNSAAAKRTSDLLAQGVPVIFEATIQYKELMARIDVLKSESYGLQLQEVKSSTSYRKSDHLPDVAFQAHVLSEAGHTVTKAELVHLDRNFVWSGGPYVASDLFLAEDITTDVARELPVVAIKSAALLGLWDKLGYPLADGASPHIDPVIQAGCSECSFHDHCSPGVPKDHVSYLGLHHTRTKTLIGRGVTRIADFPADMVLQGAEALRLSSWKAGKAVTDESLGHRLNEIRYPIHVIDFENLGPALPVVPGTRPYQVLPFQWSCHRLAAPPDADRLALGPAVDHTDFVYDGRDDPREEFVRSLKAAVHDGGSILHYSSHERTVMRTMADAGVPGAAELFALVEPRLYDLELVVKECYANPLCRGRSSIKAVLPAVAPSFSYKELAIQDGTQAATEYGAAFGSDCSAVDTSTIFANLKEYCRLDTWAMVLVLEALYTEVR